MIKKLNNIRRSYNKLSEVTRLIIRIWIISTLWATVMAIITHTSDQYSLLLLSDDLFSVARSIGAVGGICTIIAINWDIKSI